MGGVELTWQTEHKYINNNNNDQNTKGERLWRRTYLIQKIEATLQLQDGCITEDLPEFRDIHMTEIADGTEGRELLCIRR